MKQQAFIKSVMVTSVALVLSACGGGGGGDGSDREVSSGGSLSLDDGGYSTRKASLSTQEDFEGTTSAYQSSEEALDLVTEVEDVINYGGLEEIVHDGATAQAHDDSVDLACENENGSVKVTDKSVSGVIDLRYDFNSCRLTTVSFGQVELNGSYTYQESGSSSSGSESWTGSETFNISGSFVASGTPFALKGDDSWSESYDAAAEQGTLTLTSDVMEFKKGTSYVALQNSIITLSVDGNQLALSTQFKLISSAMNGYVDYTTPSPVVIDLAQESTCPVQGINRMAGDGVVEVRYGMDTGTSADVVVEVNSNTVASYETCDELGANLFPGTL